MSVRHLKGLNYASGDTSYIFLYSLAVCRPPGGGSESPQQRGPCGESTQRLSALPGAQTSGGSPGSALCDDGYTVSSGGKFSHSLNVL